MNLQTIEAMLHDAQSEIKQINEANGKRLNNSLLVQYEHDNTEFKGRVEYLSSLCVMLSTEIKKWKEGKKNGE